MLQSISAIAASLRRQVVAPPVEALEPHLHWRIYCLSNFDDSNDNADGYSATEIEMREAPGGANVATGGTATAISHYQNSATYAADRAFDGDLGTLWSSDNAAHPNPESWIAYAFPTEVVIHEFVWTARDSSLSNQSAKAGRVEWSDDGVVWTKAWAFSNNVPYANGEARTFTNPNYSSGTLLLLSGDAQTGTDGLLLSGDAQTGADLLELSESA